MNMKPKLVFIGWLTLFIAVFLQLDRLDWSDFAIYLLTIVKLISVIVWFCCFLDILITGIQNYFLTR